MNKSFRITSFMLIAGIMSTSLMWLPPALAAPQDPFVKCAENIYPFNPAIGITGNDSDLKPISTTNCFNDLSGSFPATRRKLPITPYTGLNKNAHDPIAEHEHHYIFMGNKTGGYYTRAWLRKFEIRLQQPEFNKTLKGGTLKCPLPPLDKIHPQDQAFETCNHQNDQIWNGTKVSTTNTANETIITYEFGLHDTDGTNNPASWHKPILSGINPGIDKGVYFNGDTTNDWKTRALSMTLNFVTNDRSNEGTPWSASTTSRAEVLHEVIPISAVNNNADAVNHSCFDGNPIWKASNSWCDPTVGAGYHWVNIGTVVSVWQPTTPPPPPPQPELECKNVVLTPNTINGRNVNNGVTDYKAQVTIVDKKQPNVALNRSATVVWAPPVGGTFTKKDNGPHSTQQPFTSTFQLNQNAQSATVQVNVTNVKVNAGEKFDQSSLAGCFDKVQVNFPPQGNVCTDLQILQNGSPIGDPINMKTTLTDKLSVKVTSTKDPVTGIDYVWSATNGIIKPGTFTGPGNPNSGNPKTADKPTDVQNYSGGTSGTTVTVTGIDPVTKQPLSGCSDQFTMYERFKLPEENICTDLGLKVDNMVTKATTIPVGPSTTVNLKATPVNTPPNTSKPQNPAFAQWTKSGTGALSLGPQSSALNAFDLINGHAPRCLPANFNSFTAPVECDYVYTTPATGSGSVTITAVGNATNTDVSACTATLNFYNPPQNNYCSNLSVNYQPNQVCVTPDGPIPGGYTWTVEGVIQPQKTNCFPNLTGLNNFSVVADGTTCKYSNSYNPPGPECTMNPPTYNNGQVCLNNVQGYNGPFTWQIGNGFQFSSNNNCQTVPPNTSYTITGPTASCSYQYNVRDIRPPQFVKTVEAMNPAYSTEAGKKTGMSNPLTLIPSNNVGAKTGTIDNKTVKYTLTFEPSTNQPTDATITDEDPTYGNYMNSQGYIQGFVNGNSSKLGGVIRYHDNFQINLQQCDKNITTNCYNLNTSPNGSVLPIVYLKQVSSQVTITFEGIVENSLITDYNCLGNNSQICQEKYTNTSNAEYWVYSTSSSSQLHGNIPSSAVVQSFCQYILTRASGDIFLETDLNFGKDISYCSEYKNGTGPFFTPGPPPTEYVPRTGAGTFPIDHEICTKGLPGSDLYGKNAASKTISSNICEIKLRTGDSWTKSNIEGSIAENLTRISRWEPNLDNFGNLISAFNNNSLPTSNTGVYHKSNDNLTLGTGSTLELHDGEGAKTIIVEGHDLYINNNITYVSDCPSCTINQTASLALIVLGGNVYIDKNVSQIDAVIFVQKGGDGTGNVKAANDENSFKKLTINGSVYGNIDDLLKHRKFAGDPAANEGSIVIRFSENIILNTPPGLKSLLQLN